MVGARFIINASGISSGAPEYLLKVYGCVPHRGAVV